MPCISARKWEPAAGRRDADARTARRTRAAGPAIVTEGDRPSAPGSRTGRRRPGERLSSGSAVEPHCNKGAGTVEPSRRPPAVWLTGKKGRSMVSFRSGESHRSSRSFLGMRWCAPWPAWPALRLDGSDRARTATSRLPRDPRHQLPRDGTQQSPCPARPRQPQIHDMELRAQTTGEGSQMSPFYV